jgi:predicted RNA-binding protein with PIN domain
MIYLIDGHNLIAQMPDISLDDPNDEIHLVLRLRSWAAQDSKRRVRLIFDKGLPGGKDHNLSNSIVHVRFAPEGTTADRLLIRQVKQAHNPAEYTVVSSDRAITEAAKVRKMPVLTASQFVEEMAVDRRPEPEPLEQNEPVLSEDEVAEWMVLFGPVKERKTPPPEQRTPRQRESEDDAGRKAREKKPPPAPEAYKHGSAKIDEDELAEWLELFGTDD